MNRFALLYLLISQIFQQISRFDIRQAVLFEWMIGNKRETNVRGDVDVEGLPRVHVDDVEAHAGAVDHL